MRFAAILFVFFVLFGTLNSRSAGAVPQIPGRADLIELTLKSPTIVRAEISKATKLSAKLSPGIEAGVARILVRAKTTNVLISPSAVPQEIEYLVDVKTDSKGKLPSLKGLPVLLFIESGSQENQFRLIEPWGQVDWTAEREAYVRTIAAEAVQPGARDFKVTGLGQGFFVAGSLPGESESQIFVQTESGRPVSLVVLSRPGQQRSVSLATGDIIDEAASAIRPGSLLWYHLACSLPGSLPRASTESLEDADAAAVREDYRYVRESLGRCDREFRR